MSYGVWWFPTVVVIRLSQQGLAGLGLAWAWAELDKSKKCFVYLIAALISAVNRTVAMAKLPPILFFSLSIFAAKSL